MGDPLAEEAHGLPPESEVLHGNHEGYKEPIRIVFDMKWSFLVFDLASFLSLIISPSFAHTKINDEQRRRLL
ncbi:hypothetical protein AF331_19145 [Rossellomorea marisflavi]|uniref:Uncharacterized protein n=1 Tax=Rossellomorea marisflavi TaxID=189381 RepID=A0A0M0FZJ7_9BACI|nr:hypothetical protein AF331_19145 [Rossellomorea marisflavi]